MRIIIQTGLGPGIHGFGNMGDVAMLQVAVSRLKRLWPLATIEVLTDSPDKLSTYCPGTDPLSIIGQRLWLREDVLSGRFYGALPVWINRRVNGWTRTIRQRWPRLLGLIIRSKLRLRNRLDEIRAVGAFTEAMNNTDIVVVCGAGGFFDNCRAWNMEALNTVEEAVRRNIPVAMFGQGIGPLNDPKVMFKAKSVFPRVNLITLRGNRGGLALLESLGVAPSHAQATGDEAIEMAYEARTEKSGHALGINLRISKSAETEQADIERIRPVLQGFAKRHGVPIIPVPIALHPYDRDDQMIRQLLAGLDDQSDGGITLDSPLKVIKQAGRCRVVVTGAYHAAVFALAQGIPVVGLGKSPYFVSKFLGLGDQFGLGCETVVLNEPDLAEKLDAAIERAWQSAEKVRVPLQEAARRQIELSWGAYIQVKDFLTSRTATKSAVTS
jgi:polysaccharide pyruvyl transferase WcaK-like protein